MAVNDSESAEDSDSLSGDDGSYSESEDKLLEEYLWVLAEWTSVSTKPPGEISPDGASDLEHFVMVANTDGAFPVIPDGYHEVSQPAVEVPIARESVTLEELQTPTREQFVDAQRADQDIIKSATGSKTPASLRRTSYRH